MKTLRLLATSLFGCLIPSIVHAGHNGYTYYVTGPNQDLTGSADGENIGFNPGWQMTYEDIQKMNQDFELSGTWMGGAGVDAYMIADKTFTPEMPQDENGNWVWYVGPTIHVTFDLDKIKILEQENGELNRLYITCFNQCDMKGKSYTIPQGVHDINLGGMKNFHVTGSALVDYFSGADGGPLSSVDIHSGAGDDYLIASGDNNNFYAEGGNDFLGGDDSALGSDYYGGTGDDWYMVHGPNNSFIELPNEGQDTLAIYVDNYTVTPENSANIERVVLVNQPDANGVYPSYDINGSDSVDIIEGNDANNTISGQGSGDVLNGGNGNDILVGDAPPQIAAPMSAAVMSRAAGSKLMVVSSGTGGNDKLDGGPGNDTATFSGERSEYTVNYNSSSHDYTVSDTVVGRDGTDTVKNVEFFSFSDGTKPAARILDTQLTGTEGADKLVGNIGYDELHGLGGNDTLSGLAGDDLLDGGTGADIMSGGDGNDSYIVDNAGDKVKETSKAGGGTDTVYTSLPSYTLPLNVENLVYTGASNFSGKGNKSSNRMYGGPAADKLDGQKGVDVMVGGAGDDTYVVDSTSDLVNEDPDAGFDQVTSSVTITTLSQNVEVLTLSKGNVNGTGNALDNMIIGSTGLNILSGGDGADTLIGGMGNDTFYGETAASAGDDADTISYSGAKKGVTFSLANTLAGQNTGGAGTDRIYDISGIENLTGTSFPDNLTGSAIGNVIHGGDGNDLIYGLIGPDVLFGDAGLDSIDCGADTDIDRVAYIQPSDSPVGANRDQVTNFSAENDLIELSQMDANVSAGGDQAFVFSSTTPQANSVWYVVNGADVVVQGDVNGDATPDFEVLVKSVASVTENNFAL